MSGAIALQRPEVLVSHVNARLTLHGRRLLAERIRLHGRPVAHVAAEMGASRPCGEAGGQARPGLRLRTRDGR